ncbi:hydrogenase maturation nickel metallochaperone HypA [Bdellovibrionota bacterium FG-2]
MELPKTSCMMTPAMHEVAIAQNIIEICQSHAGTHKVSIVKLEIGDLSGVIADALEFCFEACAKGTKLEGATLIINRIKGAAKCPSCASSFEVAAVFDSCPNCQSYPVEILAGKQMRVCEIELAEETKESITNV